jgi:5,10-methylenetetrahydromethanopterin reductase
MLTFGTVLDPGEDAGSDRALAAAGPAAAVAFHGTLEFTGSVDAVRGFPGGDRWAAALEAIPMAERHLAVHEGHLTHLNALDRPVITGDHVASFTFCGEAAQLRERLAAAADAGVTEVAFQPAGDVERELAAFADMAGIG